jgi:hypothetical protein
MTRKPTNLRTLELAAPLGAAQGEECGVLGAENPAPDLSLHRGAAVDQWIETYVSIVRAIVERERARHPRENPAA